MASRAVIEQAKGIVIATKACDPAAAFALLVEQSQAENRKLREVAAELVVQHSRCSAPTMEGATDDAPAAQSPAGSPARRRG
jgi:uncharacterized protein YwlG (UPF0340 family)